jgi:hypothetical protein
MPDFRAAYSLQQTGTIAVSLRELPMRFLVPCLALLCSAAFAAEPTHWAFSPVRAPLAGESIDGFVDTAIAKKGLKPLGPAEPQAILRRLHFVLTGLPATLDEQDRFFRETAESSLFKAIEHRTDELLASPHFGERWAQHWMDVVRFAETKGHEFDYEIEGAWRYRDWLIRAFNGDVPFSQFVREQLCGDLLETPRRDAAGENESRLGTIFWNLGESATSPVDLLNDEGDRIGNEIDVFGKAFCGLTIGCARCHDHKSDPIGQRDYYAIFGILASTPMDRAWTGAETYAKAAEKLRAIRAEVDASTPKYEPIVAPRIGVSRGRVAVDFASGIPQGWQIAGNLEVVTPALAPLRGMQPGVWSGLLARKLPARMRSPVFNIESNYIDVVTSGEDATIVISVNNLQVIRDPIYDDLKRRVDRPGEWQVHRIKTVKWIGQPATIEVFTGKADLLKTKPSERQQFGVRAIIFSNGQQTPELPFVALPPPPTDPRMHELAWEAEEIERKLPLPEYFNSVTDPALGSDRTIAKRGDAKTPGDLAPRGFLPVLAQMAPATKGSGRLELAEAVLAPSNPLPPRVFVNRVWQQLFGRGLVATVDDFGKMGEVPTHPELLDLLASRFARDGSFKKLIRSIVLTHAWQRKSSPDEEGGKWLASYPLRRLDGEALRDAVLAASERLDRTIGGPSVPVRTVGDFFGGGLQPDRGPIDGDGRRSIYIRVRRNFPEPFLTVFDKPAPFTSFGRRNVSNVPAQALTLMNDPFVVEQAAAWAKRIVATPGTRSERISRMHREAFARPATEAELAAAEAFLNPADNVESWAEYAHTFFNVKEFLYVP